MRQLHLVGFTSDHDGLILAARRGAKSGGYVVTMDDEFLEQVDQARRTRAGLHQAPSPEPSRTRIESALSPREMQTRMRAGRTVAQVAAEAGVPIEWVERFAAPVLAEQAAAVERAQQSTMRTQRRGYSDRALGPSVLRNLADRGIRLADDEFDQLWTAFQLAENEWVIRFRYRFRGRDLDAEWLLDEGAGSLTPGNRQATELGFVDPGRHAPPIKGLPPMRVLRRAAPVVNSPVIVQAETVETVVAAAPRAGRSAPRRATRKTAAKPATKTSAGKGAGARRAVRRSKAAARPTASRVAKKATKKAPPKKAVAKKTVAKKVVAKKVVAKRAGAKAVRKTAARKAVSKKAVSKKAVPKKADTKKAVSKRPSTKPAKPAKASPASSGAPVRRERPLKAVRIAGNGVHAGVRAGGVSANGRNGSAATQLRRVRSVSRAGGNGSRRSGG